MGLPGCLFVSLNLVTFVFYIIIVFVLVLYTFP